MNSCIWIFLLLFCCNGSGGCRSQCGCRRSQWICGNNRCDNGCCDNNCCDNNCGCSTNDCGCNAPCGNDNCGCDCGNEPPTRPIMPPPPPRPPRPPYEDCGCN